jgi:hypothetical protein
MHQLNTPALPCPALPCNIIFYPPLAGIIETAPAMFARMAAQQLLPSCKKWLQLPQLQ